MKNQEIVVILGNADKRDWHFILVQLFFQLLGRRDRLFKTYFRFNKIQDNPLTPLDGSVKAKIRRYFA